MRTACPSCDTGYTIPDERIGAKGRKVRCTRCGEEWRVLPLVDETPVPPIARPAAPPPPEPRRPAAVDPFDAVDDGFDAAGSDDPAPTPIASSPASDDDLDHDDAHDDTPAAADLGAPPPARPAAAAPASLRSRLVGRIRAHVRPHAHRRLPGIGRQTLARLTGAVTPFVGPMVFLAACLVVPGVYVFRQPIVAAAPDLAGFYAALGAPVNLRGLSFGRIETLREIDNGQPVLVVEGSIANVSRQLREVPALRFALRGPDTQELYAWSIDPKSTTIESGDTIRFRTRLAAPPDQATDVQVRFVERRSQHAGLP